MLISNDWKDYELIDAGEEEKLERWGKYILRRPDPQAIWARNEELRSKWDDPDMFYHRSNKGGGYWSTASADSSKGVPEIWTINYKDLKFTIRPTAFKHTGLFPEQAVNWERMIGLIKERSGGQTPLNPPLAGEKAVKILNLFAYTGGATVACIAAGAHVTHVDASKGMTGIAKENLGLSNLDMSKARFIVDDAVKFVEREIRRGNKYDAIIMDPPVYGRGPTGELWEIEHNLPNLVNLCGKLLSDHPLFFLINAYATTFSHVALKNIMQTELGNKLKNVELTSGEIGLPMSSRDMVLPCGLFGYVTW